MAENRRYLIALGLMETDPETIKDKNSFKHWSKVRLAVANQVEGAILAYCLQTGIYRRFSHPRAEVPESLNVIQLLPEGKESGLYVPGEFEGTPEEFVQAAVDYEQRCRRLEDKWMGFKEIIASIPWGNRFLKQRIEGPGVPLVINGVVASPEDIDQLEVTVNRVFNHLYYKSFEQFGSTELPVARCIVAQAKY